MPAVIYLNKGREKSLLRKHPWVFSRAIKQVKGKPRLGETVDIYDADGRWLAKGAYSPDSQIRVRVWSFEQSEMIDRDFFIRKVRQAHLARKDFIERGDLTGYRVVAAESDGLPGITIDRYNQVLVTQLLSAGSELFKADIVAALQTEFPELSIYDRSDVEVRKKEGLTLSKGWLVDQGHAPIQEISEYGVRIQVNVEEGHKTGFYLDQRESRRVSGIYAQGKSVLNCFSYTGTFSLHALKGGASHVENVDVSDKALELAAQNHHLNEHDEQHVQFHKKDVFKLLREYRDQGKTFDMIIMDPPKFADSKAQLNGACRGYKDINLLAMQLLKPGGYLLTFSCSGLMEPGLFQKIVADAALDAGRDVSFVEFLNQAPDHPVASFYPEGHYLKGIVCQVN
ncbi:class I SAM-dependent methyltransferase [Algicola sagamiensis]|uniref:class I SAM-dependent methyltransferase n=1 Tax=Algicola sagamiensis TaxID=163869 RepID=UPI0003686566|nr:class I SAM-dependent methyltransferase [Algicola sagamiensis]